MVKKRGIIFVISMFLVLVGCSDDASVSELSQNSTDVIVDDVGSIIDEAPMPEDEGFINDIVDIPADDPVADDPDEDDPDEDDPVADDPVVEDPDEDDPVVDDPPLHCVKKKYYKLSKLDGSGDVLKDVGSFKGLIPSNVNYNYYSWSAHPIIGVNPGGYEGHFYLYEGSDGLSFNFFYNIDAAGSADNSVKMDVFVEGNDNQDSVILSDDGAEVKKMKREDGSYYYKANMRYWKNTDGGVLGPFKGNDFKIRVKIYQVGDNKEVVFHSADGRSINLEGQNASEDLFSEFEISFHEEGEDCSDSAKKEEEQNQCIAKEYEERKEDIAASDWLSFYKEKREERKQAILELRAKHKEKLLGMKEEFQKKRLSYKDRIKALVEAYRAKRKAIVAEYRLQAQNVRKKKSEGYKDVLKGIKERRAQVLKILRDEYIKNRNHILAQRKDMIEAYKQKRKAVLADQRKERLALSNDLLKEIRALRAEMMKKQESLHKDFEEAARACKN